MLYDDDNATPEKSGMYSLYDMALIAVQFSISYQKRSPI